MIPYFAKWAEHIGWCTVFGRHEKTLLIQDQIKVLAKLCNCFARLEFTLLFLDLLLHPKYCKIGIIIMEHNIVTLIDVVKFISGYANRWNVGDDNPTAAVVEWMTYDSGITWASHASSFHRIPHQFWCVVSRKRTLDSSVHVVARVALQLFSMLPKTADPEHVFPALGRKVTPSLVNLNM